MTLAELLRDSARIEAFLDASVEALDESAATPRIDEIAVEWRRIGLTPGDVVLIALPNGRLLLRHLFGVLAAGGVPALLPPSAPAGRLEMIAEGFGARAIVAMRQRALRHAVAWHPVGGVEVALLPATVHPKSASAGDMILMTSGTSGIASGCLFDTDALLRNAAKHASAIGMTGDDTLLISLPLHFSYALVAQAFAALLLGARTVISGPPFRADAYVRTIEEHGVTVSSITPLLVRQLLAENAELPRSLRALTVGGDQPPAVHVAEVLRRAPSRELYLTYGLTEAGPRVATLAAHAEPQSRFASVGLPLPGTRVTLTDGPQDEPRELLVSSDTLMRCRIGVTARTGTPWRAPNLLATGDLFTIDDDGYLYFRGRASDFTAARGEKVSLASIRNVAAALPGVVGVRTNVVNADGDASFDLLLTLAEGVRLTVADVRAELNRVLTRAERPRNIEIAVFDASAVYK